MMGLQYNARAPAGGALVPADALAMGGSLGLLYIYP